MKMTHCCPEGSEPPLKDADYVGKGEESMVGELRVYKVGSGDKALVLIHDIYGVDSARHKWTADRIADMGYMVLLPDLFHGDRWSEDKTAVAETLGWMKTKPFEPIAKDVLEVLIPHFEQQGVKKFCYAGFCWGAWVGLKICSVSDKFVLGINYHPSWTVEEMFGGTVRDIAEKVRVPQLVMPASNDPLKYKEGGEVTNVFEKNIPGRIQVVHFQEMVHGFVVRGNPKDDRVAESISRAMNLTEKFLQQYFV